RTPPPTRARSCTHACVPRPARHSVPTRRSSDLEWAGAQAFSSFDTYLAPFVKTDHLTYPEVKKCIESFIYGVNIPSRWGTQAPRSEDHTSELQSRFDLVCRLLLEKKKEHMNCHS